VMEEIDVAILAFDDQRRLELVNRAGAKFLQSTEERARGSTAAELKVEALLEGEVPRKLEGTTYELKRTVFRRGGHRHDLLVISDVQRALRDEEREAWQRLVRVLGHEINNSLAPIRSVAQSLLSLKPQDEDTVKGLELIIRRSEGLSRFLAAYAKLAKLPPPKRQPISVADWVRRCVALVPAEVANCPDVTMSADADQLDQVLINLLKNAVEADPAHKPRVSWRARDGQLE